MPRDFGLKDNELAKLRALFESVPELEAVYVFGSRARGDHKGTSDVDLAVRTSTDHSRVTSRLKGELEEMNIIHRFDVANLADLKEGSDFARRVHKEMRVMWRRWWRTVSISDVAENHDNLRKPLSSLERSSKKGAYPYYGAAGIIDYVEKWIFDGEYLLIAEDGSVCDDMGHPTLQRPKGKFWVSNHAHVLKCKSIIDQKYLYYFLKNQDIRAFVTGAVQPKLNQENLNKIAISWPPEVERARIAEILSSLDDKIELNRQMNKTLEQIAQALFKHWFIDFEFPNEEGKPYKSSGGKMVESELGLVPEGWIYDAIGNHVKIVGGTTPSTTNPEFWNGDYHWTSPKDLSVIDGIYLLTTDKKITEAGLGQIGSGSLAEGTLLMSSRAPIGYLAFAAIPVAINQGYIAFLKDGSLPNSYMYFWLKMNMALVIASANGSTFLEISKSNFREINALIPSKELVELFDATIMPLMAAIHNGEFKNQKLDDVRERAICNLIS
jgi:type I restriction enzyme S subunit